MANHIAFISHGGGPMPLLGDPGHQQMVENLQLLASELPKPDAIVVVSAHWETPVTTLTAGANPELIYDYYGFPPESYEIQYPAPGHPQLATQIAEQLQQQQIAVELDTERGFDHGLFVPLIIMYPQADIPCLQISLNSNLSPSDHLALGEALSQLPEQNLLILGSGFSFHNLRAFFRPVTESEQAMNEGFEHWLQAACTDPVMDKTTRKQQLLQWEQAPGARFCHPREEHLLPLHVCSAAADYQPATPYAFVVMGKASSAYRW